MACTTIIVGKNASYDGSTIVARNEDSGAGEYNPKKLIVMHPEEQPEVYKSVLSKVEIPLPKEAMRCTLMPEAVEGIGIWGACGVNELNVSVTATETITSNERVLSGDPLVVYQKAEGKEGEEGYKPEVIGGIGEEDIVSLLVPFIKSARDGVSRLGSLLEVYGTYEKNGIALQDENEIWWLETIGGHHWIAKRLPDDAYAVIPNQFGIDDFDLDDALGEQKEHMCSRDMREFIEKNHLNLSLDGKFNARHAFGSHSDADHVYNTPRAWVLQRYLNPKTSKWEGEHADYKPDSDDIPWCRKPEKKITIEDVKYTMSHHFQGTEYDPYSSRSLNKGAFRPVGVNRTNFLSIVQIRPYMPDEIKSIEWIAYSSNVYNAAVPFYTNINKTPDYVSCTNAEVSTDSFYWANRLIGALSDSAFHQTTSHIERYQLQVQTEGHMIIKNFDDKILEAKPTGEEAKKVCEEANSEIEKMIKKKTKDLLLKVLNESSNIMKNAYSRSDS